MGNGNRGRLYTPQRDHAHMLSHKVSLYGHNTVWCNHVLSNRVMMIWVHQEMLMNFWWVYRIEIRLLLLARRDAASYSKTTRTYTWNHRNEAYRFCCRLATGYTIQCIVKACYLTDDTQAYPKDTRCLYLSEHISAFSHYTTLIIPPPYTIC